VILRLAVLIQYRSVTDRQTDRHTHTDTPTAYTALSIASRGKNDSVIRVVQKILRHAPQLCTSDGLRHG